MPSPYQFTRIISGGQTGADRAGLEIARDFSIPTGGHCPHNYRTENGSDPSLADFGLICTVSDKYQPRTKLNVQNSDGTVLFINSRSPGARLTMGDCRRNNKSCCAIGTHLGISAATAKLRWWCKEYNISVLNVAGNRESTNPGIGNFVKQVMKELICPKQ